MANLVGNAFKLVATSGMVIFTCWLSTVITQVGQAVATLVQKGHRLEGSHPSQLLVPHCKHVCYETQWHGRVADAFLMRDIFFRIRKAPLEFWPHLPPLPPFLPFPPM